MGRRITRIAIAVLLVAATFFLPPLIVEACGPDLSLPTFTDYNAPDAPFEVYARGKLGLLEPGYRHIYLYAAYRNLTGKPLTDVELSALKSSGAYSLYRGAPQQAATTQPPVNWVDRWQTARKQVPGDSAKVNFGYYTEKGVFRSVEKKGAYFQYYNCLEGAFENAVKVLDNRVAQFGEQSPYVKQWLAAQDQVFSNCPGGFGYPTQTPVAVIPVAAAATDPEVIREDRAYQIAAAHFYAGDFEQARAEFAAIAKDPNSPYRQIAPYLVARVLVREGTLTTGMGKIDAGALEQAKRQLEDILADKNLADMHHAARGLLEYVRIRLYPQESERKLAAALGDNKPNPDFRQNLTDYLWLLDDLVPTERETGSSNSSTSQLPTGTGTATKPSAQPNRGDMTDWIVNFQKTGPEAFQHALSRWQQTRSLPWLVAAIAQAHGSDAAAGALEAAALKVSPDSPAYVMATFHRLRLLAESGQAEAARAGLDRVLASQSLGLTVSARNQFLALRMTLATSLDDWLRHALRRPVDLGGYQYASTGPESDAGAHVFFDSDASVVLTEKLPLSWLADAAQSPAVPAALRNQIAIAVWTRAILLRNAAVARRITPVLASLAPELRSSLTAYASAKSDAQRNFAASFLFLHFPGMRPFVPAGAPRWSIFAGPEPLAAIDTFRNNWWCLMGRSPTDTQGQWNYYTMYTRLSSPLREIYPDGKIPSPAFLNASERAAAAREWSALESLPAAPSWLGQQTLAWAKAHPNDPRVPEALHLVVRATRYGCNDSDSGKYSRQAFTLLHKRYPNSPWTRKTPYWFQ